MGELSNCPKCGAIFAKTQFRDICPNCWKEEEKDYERVYEFMRKRENRAATIRQVVDSTGVEEELIYKFIKTGRLRPTQFPNLGYPCDRCGHIIQKGKICDTCTQEIKNDLHQLEKDEHFKKELTKSHKATYFSGKD